MKRLRSLKQYLKDLDSEIFEAERDMEGQKDWDARTAVRQTLRALRLQLMCMISTRRLLSPAMSA